MVDSVSAIHVKLHSISVMKFSYFLCFFGFISGLLGTIPFFILFRVLIDTWMTKVPIGGLVFVSFVIFPLVFAVLFWIFGLIFGLFINLILKLISGLNMVYEQVY